MTRLMNVTLACVVAPCWATSPTPGGWKTMTSPRSGSANQPTKRAASTRSPSSTVVRIDPVGMRYDRAMYCCTNHVRPSATAIDDDELEDSGPRRLLARGDGEAQLDPLSDPLALGRSGHALG